MPYNLNEEERELLLRQNPSTKDDGGFQRLLVNLQEKFNDETNEIDLNEDDLEKIPRYAFDYQNGGWESRLKGIFERHLGDTLGR